MLSVKITVGLFFPTVANHFCPLLAFLSCVSLCRPVCHRYAGYRLPRFLPSRLSFPLAMGSCNSENSGSMGSSDFVNFWDEKPLLVAQNVFNELTALKATELPQQAMPPVPSQSESSPVSMDDSLSDSGFISRLDSLFKINPVLFADYHSKASKAQHASVLVDSEAQENTSTPGVCLLAPEKLLQGVCQNVYETSENGISGSSQKLPLSKEVNVSPVSPVPISNIPHVCTNVLQVDTHESPAPVMAYNSLEELQKFFSTTEGVLKLNNASVNESSTPALNIDSKFRPMAHLAQNVNTVPFVLDSPVAQPTVIEGVQPTVTEGVSTGFQTGCRFCHPCCPCCLTNG